MRALSLAALIAVSTAAIARAQDVAPAQAPQAESAQAPQAQAPQTPQAPQAEPAPPESESAAAARAVVARAKALFAVGDYRAALAEFTRAYELLEGDPRQGAVLNNIAVCHERMFRYDLALQFYERYLREGNASAEDRAEVEAVMSSLRDLLGTVQVTGPVAGEVWVGERKLGTVPVDVLVPAGVYVVEIRAKGYEPVRRELRIAARATQHWNVVLEPIDTYRGLPRAYFWTGGALTAAALITGTAFGVAALNESADGDEQAARGLTVDPEPTQDLALAADIAFGAAAVLGVGTTVLFFLTDWHERAPLEQPRDEHALAVDLTATPRSLGLVLHGAMP